MLINHTPLSSAELAYLNARVAIDVMGWVPHSRNTAFYVLAGAEYKLIDGGYCQSISEWNPANSGEDAMLLLQKLGSAGHAVVYEYSEIPSLRERHWRIGTCALGPIASDPSFYVAICRCALELFKPTVKQ